MHVYRSWQPDEGESKRAGVEREVFDVRRRQDTAEVAGIARCPRCRAVLVAGVRAGRAGYFCRCIARLPIPA